MFSYHAKASQTPRAASTLPEEISPFITRSATEAPSVRLRVFLSGSTSAFVARRGFRASCSRSAKRWFVALISSASSPNFYLVDQNDLTSFPGSCPCPFYRMVFQTFDIGSLLWIRETRFHHDGERGHYPWGQSCSASVASQGNLDVKDTSVLVHPRQRKG